MHSTFKLNIYHLVFQTQIFKWEHMQTLKSKKYDIIVLFGPKMSKFRHFSLILSENDQHIIIWFVSVCFYNFTEMREDSILILHSM